MCYYPNMLLLCYYRTNNLIVLKKLTYYLYHSLHPSFATGQYQLITQNMYIELFYVCSYL